MALQTQKTQKVNTDALTTFSIRTYYDGKQKEISDLTALDQEGAISLTKQAEMPSCDINNIMTQFEKTGLIAHTNKFQGNYQDLGNSSSFHDALNQVAEAQEAFASLPAGVRSRFGNDPAQFLDFVLNPDNAEEMVKLGLASASPVGGTPIEDAIDKAPTTSKKVGKSHSKTTSEPE